MCTALDNTCKCVEKGRCLYTAPPDLYPPVCRCSRSPPGARSPRCVVVVVVAATTDSRRCRRHVHKKWSGNKEFNARAGRRLRSEVMEGDGGRWRDGHECILLLPSIGWLRGNRTAALSHRRLRLMEKSLGSGAGWAQHGRAVE